MITKGAVFITGWHSFKAWRLVEEMQYSKFNCHVMIDTGTIRGHLDKTKVINCKWR